MTTGTHCSGRADFGSLSGGSNSSPLWPLLFTLARRVQFESGSRKRFSVPAKLLQLRVLGFGFLEDGDVGVGVFPESKEILIGSAALGIVA